jgi:hypothetical protein
MSYKPKNHIPQLASRLEDYANKRMLDLQVFSPYHLRLTDGGYVITDVWTTGRYYVVMTDYLTMLEGNKTERQGEKGQLPITTEELSNFLDELFFGEIFDDFKAST